MAQKDVVTITGEITALESEITSLLPDNQVGEISAQDVRTVLTDLTSIMSDLIDSLKHQDDP